MQYITPKTLCTIVIYSYRFILEGVVYKFRPLMRFVLDFCYIGVIFLAFNLVQQDPPSRFYSHYFGYAKQFCPKMREIEFVVVFILVTLSLWALAIFFYKHFRESDISTARGLTKRALLFALSSVISIGLFLIAVISQ